ncbi:MAG TPA: enolase C-terminal domain-like protein [Acidobacteriaceae bacterium]|nr:enolase C-terminal domain-like protein [Acidobacteriaceae bacterium]
MSELKITGVRVIDLRFPTSREAIGSDAVNKDPDYSAAYCVLETNSDLRGYGITFTLGRGTDLVVRAVEYLARFAVGRTLDSITQDFVGFFREVTGDTQYRWLGPEKGVVHLAVAALLNAVWDLWARAEKKPLWKLLAEMPAEQLVSTIDFRYITDALQPEEALEMLQERGRGLAERLETLKRDGYPAYTTSVGWFGYSDAKIERLAHEALAEGWTHFKLKVGGDAAEDLRRARLVREKIGPNAKLMVDANQKWDVEEAIARTRQLAEVELWWMEEPTSPDDVLGHARIRRETGVRIATGEHCQNRVMFKQLLQAEAIDVCQIDSCRLAGVNENLAVMLMAAKFGVPVCPHAGGVGLCEMVQHLSAFDYLRVSATMADRVTEFVDHLHEHFVDPVRMRRGRYLLPEQAGYSSEIKVETLEQYRFPDGPVWKEMP